MLHETFHYTSWEDIDRVVASFGGFLPHSDDLSVLFTPLAIGSVTSPNRHRASADGGHRRARRTAAPARSRAAATCASPMAARG